MTPTVSWYVAPDGSCRVFMHEGDIIRSFPAASVAAAQNVIVSVALAEFGMVQPEAGKLAQAAVADQMKVGTLPETTSDHMKLLADARAGLQTANAQNVQLRQQLAAAQQRIAPSPSSSAAGLQPTPIIMAPRPNNPVV